MFKVGDRVRIRQWDDMEREFGLDSVGDIDCRPFFTQYMRDEGLCGRTATIIDIYPNGRVDLDFDDKSGEIGWQYSTAMIDPLEDGRIQVTSDVATTFEYMFNVLDDLYSKLDDAYDALHEKYLKLEKRNEECREKEEGL